MHSMKLRTRAGKQRVGLVGAPGDASGAFEDRKPTVRPPDAIAKTQRNRERNNAVETVIRTLGRVDIFDAASLAALRLTCTAFRDLVDSTDAVSTARFIIHPRRSGRELLEAWATKSGLTPRTRSLSIAGELPAALAEQTLMTLTNQRPLISTLELNWVGATADPLLTAPLDAQRELHIKTGTKSCRFLSVMIENPSLRGLKSLEIEEARKIDGAALAAALAHLPDLQHLVLDRIDKKGKWSRPGDLQDSLVHLETLELCIRRGGIERLGLLGDRGPPLPALRCLKVFNTKLALKFERSPWLKQLTKLILYDRVSVSRPGLVAALNGGPLQELHLSWTSFLGGSETWDWNALDLPHLSHLELYSYSGDPLGDIAHARLPALRSATLQYNRQIASVYSVIAFSAAFPHLSELKLQDLSRGPPSVAVVEALSRDIVPRLEALEWSTATDDTSALTPSLLTAGPAYGAPSWPLLRSLEVAFYRRNGNMYVDQFDMMAILVDAAPHMPALTSLRIRMGHYMMVKTADALVAAAREAQAWPLLKNMHVFCADYDREQIASKLQELWPGLAVESTQ